MPLDHARSTSQNRALVTSGNGLAVDAAGFRLRLGGGVALRLRFSPHSTYAPLLPLADPQTEASFGRTAIVSNTKNYRANGRSRLNFNERGQ